MAINASLSEGLGGRVWPDRSSASIRPGEKMPSGVPSILPDIPAVQQRALCIHFENPAYAKGFVFPARLLDSVSQIMVPRVFREMKFIGQCGKMGVHVESGSLLMASIDGAVTTSDG